MARWKNRIIVHRSAADVFAFILEPANTPKWHRGSAELVQITDGPVGVGTQYRMQMRTSSRHNQSITEIIEYEANRRVTFKTLSGPFSFRMQYLLKPQNESTELTETVEVDIHGIFRLLTPLFVLVSNSNSRNGLHKLKRIMETGS